VTELTADRPAAETQMLKLAFYGRVSTEDQQDPESSRAWQLHRSLQLIEPHGGVLVTEYFDCGHSRALPWQRRPAASRLLEALRIPTAALLAW
jgi:DNA invertase Pin-like site-specific DNA recombinase